MAFDVGKAMKSLRKRRYSGAPGHDDDGNCLSSCDRPEHHREKTAMSPDEEIKARWALLRRDRGWPEPDRTEEEPPREEDSNKLSSEKTAAEKKEPTRSGAALGSAIAGSVAPAAAMGAANIADRLDPHITSEQAHRYTNIVNMVRKTNAKLEVDPDMPHWQGFYSPTKNIVRVPTKTRLGTVAHKGSGLAPAVATAAGSDKVAPYAGMAMAAPLLYEEGAASLRALRDIRRFHGGRAMLRAAPSLGAAWAGYAAAPAAAGLASHLYNKHRKRQEAEDMQKSAGIAKGLLSGLLGVSDFSGEVLARQAGKAVRRSAAPAAVGGGTALAVKKHGHHHEETEKQAMWEAFDKAASDPLALRAAQAVGRGAAGVAGHLDRRADRYLAAAGTGAALVGAHASLRSAKAREHQAFGEKTAFWEGFDKEAAVFGIPHHLKGADPKDVGKVINRLSNLKPRHLAVGGAAAGLGLGAGASAGKRMADAVLRERGPEANYGTT